MRGCNGYEKLAIDILCCVGVKEMETVVTVGATVCCSCRKDIMPRPWDLWCANDPGLSEALLLSPKATVHSWTCLMWEACHILEQDDGRGAFCSVAKRLDESAEIEARIQCPNSGWNRWNITGLLRKR